ncbi:MAG: hypothetical protein EHM93_19095 [Bacteroidales bacterium]|nr:MAG: hypothetical protein EHM93_19095 [Bacteroidales bacterium]
MNKEKYILTDDIEKLLSKYYDGMTSVKEEKLLKEYFAENRIPQSYLDDQAILSFGRQEDYTLYPNNELWDKIQQNDSKQNKYKRIIRVVSSVAASILIVVAFGIGYHLSSSKHDLMVTDTYSNPEDAYKAVQKYLGFTSMKLSYAFTELKPIEKLTIPSEAIQPFSYIDKNLQRLNHLERLNSTSQKLKQLSVITDFIQVDDNN